MRINVYGEEMTDETQLVEKVAKQADGNAGPFYGLRLFLKSPDVLHHTPEDDDRSAITFWVPWTYADGYDITVMRDAIEGLNDQLDEVVKKLSM